MRTSWWAWPALGGILVGLALLARAALGMIAGLTDDAREHVRGVLRERVRFISVGGVVGAWTLVYALYSMTLPANIQAETTQPEAAPALGGEPAVEVPGLVPPTVGGTVTAPAASDPPGDEGGGRLPPTPELPPVEPGETQEPCSVKAQADMVRALQKQIEAITGPIGADVALLVDAVAGCSDPASAALALLGPVNTIIQRLGVLPDTIDLPDTQPLVIPTIPEPIAAPLRPVVFEACAEASRQLVTVGALSIFLHLDYNDLVAVFRNVDAVCSAFAPA
jgi:hypothetical protein